MRILQLASEATPYAKTGGLGDVVGALCRDLGGRGHGVTLCLPLYRAVVEAGFDPPDPRVVLAAGVASEEPVVVRELPERNTGVRVWLIDVPRFFDRDGLYGTGEADHPDNAARFAIFVRASLAAVAHGIAGGQNEVDGPPHLVHCHDWQTALAPAYLAGSRERPPVLLTVHNLAYQGAFPGSDLAATGLGGELAGAFELHGGVNFLKGGLLLADRVSTVSPTYAREITTRELGFGLDGVLRGLRPPVCGILNGIDTAVWNPATDAYLPATYDSMHLEGKEVCKRRLQEEFGLRVDSTVPLFGMVARLVEQKGLPLIERLVDRFPGWKAQYAFLGTGEPRYERLLRRLAAEVPAVGARIAFSESLAHLVEAGSDFFLMPSGFEPCGLNQMISQAYGTVPIVRRVGGLADSVVPASEPALADGTATGIAFEEFEPRALSQAIDEAIAHYADGAAMRRLIQAGMRKDFSWAASGRRYEELYHEMLHGSSGERGSRE